MGYTQMQLSGSFIWCCMKLQMCEWGVPQAEKALQIDKSTNNSAEMGSVFFLGSLVLKSWGFSRAWCSLASLKLHLSADEAPGLQFCSCFRQVPALEEHGGELRPPSAAAGTSVTLK